MGAREARSRETPVEAVRLGYGLQRVGGTEVGHRRVVVRGADKQRSVLGAEMPAAADVGGTEDGIADAAD